MTEGTISPQVPTFTCSACKMSVMPGTRHICSAAIADFDEMVRKIIKEELTKVLGFQQVNMLNNSGLCGDHACATHFRCAQPLSCRKWQGDSWS